MKKSDFHYELPPHLIAQQPLSRRSDSRLLCLDGETGDLADRRFTDLPELLRAGDLLVFNNTRVIPARLFGEKDSGGRIEVLVERLLDDHRLLAQCRASKPPKPGQILHLQEGVQARVENRRGEFYELSFETGQPLLQVLERIGHMPLPPYIERADTGSDRERYQTIWARVPGAVAAPTAGLHFDPELLARIEALGVERTEVTLHVGAGTFQPMRVEELSQHRMHHERIEVSDTAAARINAARASGRRVIAVGTTAVRTLESVVVDGEIRPFRGETGIFIYPGFRFQSVDALITNFHLPESTLLMLVCAFAGTRHVLRAYRHAVEQGYRFFSYGDAMFVTAEKKAGWPSLSR